MPPLGRKSASSRSSRQVGRRPAGTPPDLQAAPGELVPLTPREIEILKLMADGLFNREISDRLWLAQETVKTHVHHVLTKLGARSRAHAVAIGLRSGLID